MAAPVTAFSTICALTPFTGVFQFALLATLSLFTLLLHLRLFENGRLERDEFDLQEQDGQLKAIRV